MSGTGIHSENPAAATTMALLYQASLRTLRDVPLAGNLEATLTELRRLPGVTGAVIERPFDELPGPRGGDARNAQGESRCLTAPIRAALDGPPWSNLVVELAPVYPSDLADLLDHLAVQLSLALQKSVLVEKMALRNSAATARKGELKAPSLEGQLHEERFRGAFEHELQPPQREYAETIEKSSESLLTLLNDILDYSKIEAGRMTLDSIEMRIRRVVEEVFELMSPLASSKDLELTLWFSPEIPSELLGDPGRVRQVLLNLLSNAVKFTPAGGEVQISVAPEARQDVAAKVRLRFEVQDSGIGITPENSLKLFQPFVQGDSSTKRTYGGTGLGLAICQRLVSLMDGEIGCIHNPGPGSTFWFSIPREVNRRLSSPLGPDPFLAGQKLLLIDPSPSFGDFVRSLAVGWGMECETCAPSQAPSRFKEAAHGQGQPFTLVLLNEDAERSDLARLGVARAAGDFGNAKVLVTSRRATASRTGVDVLLDVEGYVVKPLAPSELELVLRVAVSPSPRVSGPQKLLSLHPEVNTIRLLVAEDNAVNQKVLRHQLNAIGHRAELTSNGLELLEAWDKKKTYGLILMDCQMPEMDGLETTREIRRREREAGGCEHIPIVALTAGAFPEDRQMCLAAGMDDSMSKPVRQNDLRDMIDRWIRRQES